MADEKNINADLAEKLSDPKTVETLNHLLDRFVEMHETGALDSLMQSAQAISFLQNTMTESMVTKNASMMGELGNIANEAADPSMAEAMRDLKELQQSGNLKTLLEASYMVAFMTNVVSDSMVQRIATFISDFISEVSAPQVQDMLGNMTKCMSNTIKEFRKTPPQPGIKSLFSLMKDPDVQMGLMFMSHLAKNMHRCMIGNNHRH